MPFSLVRVCSMYHCHNTTHLCAAEWHVHNCTSTLLMRDSLACSCTFGHELLHQTTPGTGERSCRSTALDCCHCMRTVSCDLQAA